MGPVWRRDRLDLSAECEKLHRRRTPAEIGLHPVAGMLGHGFATRRILEKRYDSIGEGQRLLRQEGMLPVNDGQAFHPDL